MHADICQSDCFPTRVRAPQTTTAGRFLAALVLGVALMAIAPSTDAARVRDLATIQGVRPNQLIGYGLVVGLDGTGDQTPYTVQSILSMLTTLGVTLPPGVNLAGKNAAGVVVTANLPAFAQPGQLLDVTVSSLGNAKSLRGGTLLMTPLKGADGEVYAMSQGSLLVGGAGASGAGSSTQVNHLSAGRIVAGATVERAVPTQLAQSGFVQLELTEADFTTASRMVDVINQRFGSGTASAVDGRVVRVLAPAADTDRIRFLGDLELLEVSRPPAQARVILNARTGSIVMNQAVSIGPCAVAHGNLSIVVKANNTVSQPNPLAQGSTVGVTNAEISISSQPGQLVLMREGPQLSDVVQALNAMGATPQDLLAILQAMKSAGALRAELEVI